MKAPPVTEESLYAMRVIAGDFVKSGATGWPQIAAFANGEKHDSASLHKECSLAVYTVLGAGGDALELRRLERFARAENERAVFRYRLRIAVEGLAEWGESLASVKAQIEPAFNIGARHRR